MESSDPFEDGIPAPPPTSPPDAVRAAIKGRVLAASLGKAAEPAKLGGRYRLIREIGRGGIGTVWEAELEPIGRKVAIKLLRAKRGQQRDVARRLVREAVSVSQIGHPHIVAVHDVGTDDSGAPYLVMDLLTGESLASLLARVGSLPWVDVQTIAEQICDALGAAHDLDVVHRDVKPANVFVRRDATGRWHCTLLDFGLCKAADEGTVLTAAGMLLGTPGYMAPEQIRGDEVDARADVYAVACIVVEMLRGQPTFPGARREEILAAQLEGRHAALPSSITTSARDALRRALSVDREQRPSSAAELGRALRATSLAQTRPAFAAPPRSRSGWVIGAVTMFAFGVGIAIVQGSRDEPEPREVVVTPASSMPRAPAQPQPAPPPPATAPIIVEPAPVVPVVEPTKATRRPRKRSARPIDPVAPPPTSPAEAKPKRPLVDGIRDPFAVE
jgi:serine/threonine protein kinase